MLVKITDIDDIEAKFLAEAIRENGYVIEVDLRCNKLKNNSLKALVLSCFNEKWYASCF